MEAPFLTTDDSAWQHVGKRPDPGSAADHGDLYDGGRVSKELCWM
jgi:hypothetical protein